MLLCCVQGATVAIMVGTSGIMATQSKQAS